jgi:hypothetical protein
MGTQLNEPCTVEEHAALLRDGILDEILYAFSGKRSGLLQGLIAPLARVPASHFGRIAAEFYAHVNGLGISQAARTTLQSLNHTITIRGAEKIPDQGPLLLVSNHPGGLDSIGILSCMPRNDLRALVTDVKFMHLLDYYQRYLFYVDFKATGGMVALRDAIQQLKTGGALLLFAHGEVEPEPECFPGAGDEISRWSPSIEIMLHKVPETLLQIITVSGAVQARYLRNPITLLRKQPARRQKLAEFLQVISSILFPKSSPTQLHLTIGEVIETQTLGHGRWMPEVIRRGKTQLGDHLRWVKSISPKA